MPNTEDLENIPEEKGDELFWYTLMVFNDEERSVSTIKEHVMLCKLQNKIVDVKFFREHIITESSDYPPDSDEFPKRGFKTTEKSAWVKLSSGNYRRIRLTERRPFSGMIFIKMVHDPELFKLVRSWDAGFSFLGSPAPVPMTDLQMQKTESSLVQGVPNILDYIKEKNYLLVEGFVSAFKNVFVEEPTENLEGTEDPLDEQISLEESSELEIEEKPKTMEDKKAEIYSDLNIKQYEDNYITQQPKFKKKSDKDFAVNDFVFIKHLGFKGVIQEINLEEGTVIVGVQMFGRRQPVECKIFEISAI